jgi:hypothetical protein
MQTIPSHRMSLRTILILSFFCLGLLNGISAPPPSMRATCHTHLIIRDLITLIFFQDSPTNTSHPRHEKRAYLQGSERLFLCSGHIDFREKQISIGYDVMRLNGFVFRFATETILPLLFIRTIHICICVTYLE